VLTVWEAMNLLDRLQVRTEIAEISNILAEAEAILLSLVTALVRCTKKRDEFSEGVFYPLITDLRE